MASVTGQLGGRLGLERLPWRFLAVLAAAPVALGIGLALPAEGAGLALRLAAAAACVLILPGALVLRALDWPRSLGLAVAGSLVWSLAVVFVALLLTFAADGSLSLTVALVGVACGGALVPALRTRVPGLDRRELLPVAALLVGGIALCGAVWWASATVSGDALFHLARVRKLDEFPVLSSVWVVNEFRGGDLHPGYAFPLWHGVLALVARFAAVDPTLVVLHLSAVLAPLALVLAYAAGRTLFASRAGGVAAAVAQAALLGFQRDGVGSFELTALPASAARLLLVPSVLALAFAYVRGGRQIRLLTLGIAALGLAVVHVTYALFLVVPLVGFLLARLLLARRDGRRIGLALAALVVPTGLFLAWLFPAVSETAGFSPSAAEESRALEVYGSRLDFVRGWYALSPETIARGGAATVAALLAIPAAALAARRRWAAYVLGGSLAVLFVLLVPPVFTTFSDLASLSQARRLTIVLPLAFALAGAATLAGRLRVAGVVGAAGLAVGLQLAFPSGADEPARLAAGGPGWATWLAVGGGLAALAVGVVARRRGPEPTWWAVAVVCAFAVPLAVWGFADLERDPPDRRALTPGLVEALRTEVPLRATVFADLETSYRIGAVAPLYVAANPPAHVADSPDNEPYERRRDVIRFFYDDDVSYVDKARILANRGATWLVVDKSRKVPSYLRFLPPPVYEDERFALYPLRRSAS